jgi:addiction module HigA family antidote
MNPKYEDDDIKLLSRKEAAAFLRLKPNTLTIWAMTGKYRLPYIKLGKTVRYRMSDLKEFSDKIPNIHPGEILREEFMKPLELSSRKLARHIGVSASTINNIILERQGITAITALRLGEYFKTTPQFWMNLQVSFELMEAELKEWVNSKEFVNRLLTE